MAIAIKYSTGPVENAIGINKLPGISRVVFAKALNNSSKRATVHVRLFRLNGKKSLVASHTLTLAPGSSGFVQLNVAQLFQFEIEFIVKEKNVLVSAWGKRNGVPVAVHRFTQEEMNKIYINV
ncbi:hypothetical protein [Paenibacillus sp. SI8]|uniref:hypothetical protein n=1 Tax=unclassified Paenibacillus TaxID=185978 RepID=UPI003466A101